MDIKINFLKRFLIPLVNKYLVILSLIILFSSHYVSASATSENPHRPFLSSVPAVLISASPEYKPREGAITLHPDRSKISTSKRKNIIKYTYKIQKNPKAPFLVVLPGIGGKGDSGSSLFLSEVAFNLGYSVITLPSTTHWSFALAASKTGRTGHLPDDSMDLYHLLLAISTKLQEGQNIEPSFWGLLGSSYGALDGSFLLYHDLVLRKFNFQFLIVINPPLSRSLATSKVDQYYFYGQKWPDRKKKGLETFFVNRVLNETMSVNKIDSFKELEHAFPMDENELAWLMGNMFRRVIKNSASIGNKLENNSVGILPSDLPSNALKSVDGTIKNYLREKLYKKYFNAETEQAYSFLEAQSEITFALARLNEFPLNNKKVILFHAMNDYLSFPEGQNQLSSLPMEKYLYPYGGHLGLLTDEKMLGDLRKKLIDLKPK